MTSRWMFFPAPSSPGLSSNLQVTATLDATVQAARYNLTSWAKSGSDLSDWEEYTNRPLRKTSTFVLLVVSLDTAESWSSASDFQTSTTNYTGEMTIGGTTLNHSSIGATAQGTDAIQFRFYASSTDVTTFWNGVTNSQSLLFNVSYESV